MQASPYLKGLAPTLIDAITCSTDIRKACHMDHARATHRYRASQCHIHGSCTFTMAYTWIMQTCIRRRAYAMALCWECCLETQKPNFGFCFRCFQATCTFSMQYLEMPHGSCKHAYISHGTCMYVAYVYIQIIAPPYACASLKCSPVVRVQVKVEVEAWG